MYYEWFEPKLKFEHKKKKERILIDSPERIVSGGSQAVRPKERQLEVRRMVGHVLEDLLLPGIARKIVETISSPSSGGVVFQTK